MDSAALADQVFSPAAVASGHGEPGKWLFFHCFQKDSVSFADQADGPAVAASGIGRESNMPDCPLVSKGFRFVSNLKKMVPRRLRLAIGREPNLGFSIRFKRTQPL